MLASSSLSEQSAPVASAHLLNTLGAKQSLDQLQTQIKALHLQAMSTQHAIEQLAQRDVDGAHNGLLSDDPWTMGAEGFVLALGALLVGALLGRLSGPRRAVDAPASAQSRFEDSQMYLGRAEQIPMPSVRDAGSDLPADPMPDHASEPLPLVFNHMDFEQSASFLELESVIDLFLDDAQPPVEPNGFDHEAAAGEVARVRKSLAQKREARARQRACDVSVHSPLPLMDRSSSAPLDAVWDQIAPAVMQRDENDEPSGGVDLLLDLPQERVVDTNLFGPVAPVANLEAAEIVEPDKSTFELQSAESETPRAEEQLMAQNSHLALVLLDTPVEPEPQSHVAVQLALALELETVGLLDGAREIAREVLESSDDALRLKAEALMARLDWAGDSVAPRRSGARRAAS